MFNSLQVPSRPVDNGRLNFVYRCFGPGGSGPPGAERLAVGRRARPMRTPIRPSIRILSGMLGLAFAIPGVLLITAPDPPPWPGLLLISALAAAFLLPAIHPVGRAADILSVLILGAFAVSIGFCYYGMVMRRDPRSTSPDEAYRRLIADPIPAAVTDLQGGGTTWQGYNILLRFRAPSLENAGFTHPPYLPVDCARVYPYLATKRLDPSPFIPPWKIPEAGERVCLEWSELSNDWTTLGNHWVVYVDGWVFFVGGGG